VWAFARLGSNPSPGVLAANEKNFYAASVFAMSLQIYLNIICNGIGNGKTKPVMPFKKVIFYFNLTGKNSSNWNLTHTLALAQ